MIKNILLVLVVGVLFFSCVSTNKNISSSNSEFSYKNNNDKNNSNNLEKKK